MFFGYRLSDSRFRVSGFEFQISGIGFRISQCGCGPCAAPARASGPPHREHETHPPQSPRRDYASSFRKLYFSCNHWYRTSLDKCFLLVTLKHLCSDIHCQKKSSFPRVSVHGAAIVWSRAPSFLFLSSCFGFRVPDFGYRVSGTAFRVSGFGYTMRVRAVRSACSSLRPSLSNLSTSTRPLAAFSIRCILF